jgi:hypothetical protein
MRTLIAFIVFAATLPALAQVQTQSQCEATVRARAPISMKSSEIKNLCQNNSMAVVDCTLTQIQSAHISTTYDEALKRCRADWNPN